MLQGCNDERGGRHAMFAVCSFSIMGETLRVLGAAKLPNRPDNWGMTLRRTPMRELIDYTCRCGSNFSGSSNSVDMMLHFAEFIKSHEICCMPLDQEYYEEISKKSEKDDSGNQTTI